MVNLSCITAYHGIYQVEAYVPRAVSHHFLPFTKIGPCSWLSTRLLPTCCLDVHIDLLQARPFPMLALQATNVLKAWCMDIHRTIVAALNQMAFWGLVYNIGLDRLCFLLANTFTYAYNS